MGLPKNNFTLVKEALGYYQRVLEKKTSDINSMIDIAGIYIRQGNYAGANQQLQQAMAIDSTDTSVLRMFGYSYPIQEQYDKAIIYARQAFERSELFFSYNLLAWLI